MTNFVALSHLIAFYSHYNLGHQCARFITFFLMSIAFRDPSAIACKYAHPKVRKEVVLLDVHICPL